MKATVGEVVQLVRTMKLSKFTEVLENLHESNNHAFMALATHLKAATNQTPDDHEASHEDSK